MSSAQLCSQATDEAVTSSSITEYIHLLSDCSSLIAIHEKHIKDMTLIIRKEMNILESVRQGKHFAIEHREILTKVLLSFVDLDLFWDRNLTLYFYFVVAQHRSCGGAQHAKTNKKTEQLQRIAVDSLV